MNANLPLDVQAHGVVCAIVAAREEIALLARVLPKSVSLTLRTRLMAEAKRLSHAEAEAREVHTRILALREMMRWMERIGGYDCTKLDPCAPVFDTFDEMRKAQPR
jgi:hypothetical protein